MTEEELTEEELTDFEVRAGGKIITGKRGLVPIDSLHLDRQNVRFRHKLGITEPQMEKDIRSEGDLSYLCRDIEYTGGLREHIIVDFKNIVKEGNRRLVCFKKLRDEAKTAKEKEKWEKIDALILSPNTPAKDISLYLAIVHVSRGRKPWRLFNRAAYIHELHDKYEMSYDQLRDALGMAKATLIRHVKAFEANEEYFRETKDDKWVNKFSYFYEFYKSNMDRWNKGEYWLNKVIKWIKEGRIGKGADMRLLPGILKYPEVLRRFENDNTEHAIENAYEELTKRDPLKADSFYRSVERVRKKIYDLTRSDISLIAANDAKFNVLLQLKEQIDESVNEIIKIRKGGGKE